MTDLGTAYREQFQSQFVMYGSARFLATFTSVAQTTTNRETGVVSPGADAARPAFYMVLDREKLEKMPGIIINENETGVTFPALDLTDGVDPVDPKINDFYVTDGNTWMVTGVYPDNFKAMWLLKVKSVNRG